MNDTIEKNGKDAADRLPLGHEMLRRAAGEDWRPAQVEAAIAMLEGGRLAFPPGRRTVPPGLVEVLQRVRLELAMLQAVSERGWWLVTVDDVAEISRLSRTVLYFHFEDKEELFIHTLDDVLICLHSRLERATSGADSWRPRLRLGLEEVLRFAAEEPFAARALIIDSRSAGGEGARRHDSLLDHFANCIEAHTERALGRELSELTAQGIVGGVVTVLYLHLAEGREIDPERLLGPLMFHTLAPYVGPSAALAGMDASASPRS